MDGDQAGLTRLASAGYVRTLLLRGVRQSGRIAKPSDCSAKRREWEYRVI